MVRIKPNASEHIKISVYGHVLRIEPKADRADHWQSRYPVHRMNKVIGPTY